MTRQSRYRPRDQSERYNTSGYEEPATDSDRIDDLGRLVKHLVKKHNNLVQRIEALENGHQHGTLVPLHQRLRAVRVQRGKTLSEVAASAHIGPSTLSDIERGKMQPSLTVLERLAAAYGLSILALCTGAIGWSSVPEPPAEPGQRLLESEAAG